MLKRMGNALQETGPVVVLVVAAVWWLLIWRMMPIPVVDHGLFVSVAERLIAGDRLYADVFENKDPLFHYLNAVSRLPSPYGSWVLAVALVALCSASAHAMLRRLGASRRATVLVAWGATPIIVVGASYIPGAAHMPAVALTLVAIAATARRNAVIAGVALAAVAGLKLIMFPMAVVVVMVIVIGRKAWRWGLVAALVAVTAISVTIGVMLLRGEWVPYLMTLAENVQYSQVAAGTTQVVALGNHLQRVFTIGNLVIVGATAFLLSAALAIGIRSPEHSRDRRLLSVAGLAGLFAALGILALTGLWPHHAMVVTPLAVLSIVVLSANPRIVRFHRPGPGAVLAMIALAWVLAGVPLPTLYTHPLEYARANLNLQVLEPVETRLIRETGPPSTYARVGGGEDGGHAFGLRDWDLVCRRFAQGYWDSPKILGETLACLPRARVIFVDPDAKHQPQYPDWNTFIDGVERLLANSYDCKSTLDGRVCVRRGTATP